MSLLSSARRSSLTKGLIGGSRPWLVVGALAWSLKALQWALRPSPTTVYRGRLEVGETVVISHEPAPPTRRQRRRSRKLDRRADKKEARRASRL